MSIRSPHPTGSLWAAFALCALLCPISLQAQDFPEKLTTTWDDENSGMGSAEAGTADSVNNLDIPEAEIAKDIEELAEELVPSLTDGGADLTPPQDIPILFITHPTSGYDSTSIALPGITRSILAAQRLGWTLYTLDDCSGDPKYKSYLPSGVQSASICSDGGEHQVPVTNQPLYFTGGYFGVCALKTGPQALVPQLQAQISETSQSGIDVYYIEDALYLYNQDIAYRETLGQGLDNSNPSEHFKTFRDPLKKWSALLAYIQSNLFDERSPLAGRAVEGGGTYRHLLLG